MKVNTTKDESFQFSRLELDTFKAVLNERGKSLCTIIMIARDRKLTPFDKWIDNVLVYHHDVC
jgi:hypothetical protein